MVDFKGKVPLIENSGLGLKVPEIVPVAENREHTNSVDAICANPT